MYAVRCKDPNCSYYEEFADKYNATEYAKFHSRRTGHNDVVMEAIDAE